MSTSADLMGLGMPGPLASRLGNNPTTLVTTGTTSGTAATIQSKLVTLTTAGSQTGAILQDGLSLGSVTYITNPTATSAVIYPPSGSTFNLSPNTSITLAQYKSVAIVRTSSTTFMTNLSA